MSARTESADYWSQLDGLRAFAVLGVLVQHYLPPTHLLQRLGISLGETGVMCFFVLSGFLITGILLRCRDLHETEQIRNGLLLRQFYMRRFLRIFPLFYVAIAVCLCLGLGRMRETWPWHVTYLSNVGVVLREGFGHSFHFWSLAVEEQFYVVWPLLILYLPRRMLLPLILASIACAPVFRLGMSLAPVPWLARFMLTPACLDSLAAGALLAWLRHHPALESLTLKLCWIALLSGLAVRAVLISGWLPPLVSAVVVTGLGRLAWAGVFIFVVAAASKGIPGLVGWILNLGPVGYLGRISYGVYVIHHFMIDVLNRAVPADFFDKIAYGIEIRFLILTVASVAVASLSYFCLEQPFNRLKVYFPYRGLTNDGVVEYRSRSPSTPITSTGGEFSS